jgi:hypothetical protein
VNDSSSAGSIVGLRVAPGGSPVVSIGISVVTTTAPDSSAPHDAQRPLSTAEVKPHRAQTMCG